MTWYDMTLGVSFEGKQSEQSVHSFTWKQDQHFRRDCINTKALENTNFSCDIYSYTRM